MGFFVNLLLKQRARIGVGATAELLPSAAIELDASIDETHSAENEVTQFPVEVGVDITDHVRKQPERLRLRGIVTDHPLGTIVLGLGAGRSNRSLDAYAKLRKMIDEAQLVSVVTTLRTYENMVIESVEIPRNAALGQSLTMNLDLREIKTAQVAETSGLSDLGTQNATTVG